MLLEKPALGYTCEIDVRAQVKGCLEFSIYTSNIPVILAWNFQVVDGAVDDMVGLALCAWESIFGEIQKRLGLEESKIEGQQGRPPTGLGSDQASILLVLKATS